LLSFIVMLYRMKTQRSCRGVSLKSQILFLIVFCCRYLVLCAKREAREAKGGGGTERRSAPIRASRVSTHTALHGSAMRWPLLLHAIENRRAHAACGRRVGTAGCTDAERAVARPQLGSGRGRRGVCV
jgi:hypothetical protein